jgi:hypothetical protein
MRVAFKRHFKNGFGPIVGHEIGDHAVGDDAWLYHACLAPGRRRVATVANTQQLSCNDYFWFLNYDKQRTFKAMW